MDTQILNDITSAFVNALEAGTVTLAQYSLRYCWSSPPSRTTCNWAAARQWERRVGEALASVLLTVLKIGIFEWLLVNLQDLANAAFATFTQWGASAGGDFTASRFLNPGAVAETGFRVARPIRDFTDSFIKWLAVWDWPTLLIYSLFHYLIVFAFLALALGGCPRISTSGSLNPSLACRARGLDGSLPLTPPCLCNAMAAPQRHDALRRALSGP